MHVKQEFHNGPKQSKNFMQNTEYNVQSMLCMKFHTSGT